MIVQAILMTSVFDKMPMYVCHRKHDSCTIMDDQQDNIKSLSSHYHRLIIQRIARHDSEEIHTGLSSFSIAVYSNSICTVQKFVKPKLKRRLYQNLGQSNGIQSKMLHLLCKLESGNSKNP